MKEFIESVAKSLVDHPEEVIVETKSSDEKKIFYTLKVKSDDIGKVIGKKGRNAQAIRTLLTAISAKEGKRAFLEIIG